MYVYLHQRSKSFDVTRVCTGFHFFEGNSKHIGDGNPAYGLDVATCINLYWIHARLAFIIYFNIYKQSSIFTKMIHLTFQKH